MNLAASAPDHTTVSRQSVGLPIVKSAPVPKGSLQVLIDSTGLAVFGANQWMLAKHGAKPRTTWRNLQLVADADSGMLVSQVLTDQPSDDASKMEPLRPRLNER